jgi:hypothetical protein
VFFTMRPPLFGDCRIGGVHWERSGEPALWAEESADDALPLLEDALREDEPSLWGPRSPRSEPALSFVAAEPVPTWSENVV